jgi:hypothetical protein
MILIQEKLCTHLFSCRKTFCDVSAAGILDWLAGPAVACQAVPKKFQWVTTNNNRMPQAQNHEASQVKPDDPEIRTSETWPGLEPWPQKRIRVCHARSNNLAHLWWFSLIIKELGEYFRSGSQ